MSWRDRDYAEDSGSSMGRPGGDWQGVRPTFENPLTWSVPFVRAFQVAVRVHVIFLIYIVISLGQSLTNMGGGFSGGLGFTPTAIMMAALFVIVLLHEFGHIFACRFMHGEANEILMWPLGGLAFCRPPNTWQAHFITAAGGPLVNVVIAMILGPVLAIICAEGFEAAIPSLITPWTPPTLPGFRQPYWLIAIASVYQMNALLLLFNLLPIFPLDGGRLAQALLWPRFGYVHSMRLAVYTGYLGAIGLGIFGFVAGQLMLVAIALFGGLTCYITLKQVQFTEQFMDHDEDAYAASQWTDADIRESAEEDKTDDDSRRASKWERDSESGGADDSAEIDRILAKIAREGMGSLTGHEQRLLRRATDRRRQGSR